MAELGESGDVHSGRGKKRGGVRARKLSTRIDMTPMVDLGFLLVTFFILTSTMQKPKAMQVTMPQKPDSTVEVWGALESMTIVLGPNDRIYYYAGMNDNSEIQEINFSSVRKFLIDKNHAVLELQKEHGWKQHGVNILIKPMEDSKYQDVVNLLDEMNITHIKSYAIEDVGPSELRLIQSKTSTQII
ncbi:MAG TPA: biopolymer transporter ExbD [Chitinophagales bacterium]|nr:biopolymer transporter ExbD [Chitinophagales bacterium]